jgi:DegV family protein with EDD domain
MPKSSCPSPDDYLKAYRGDEEGVFVITLSSELSGSYSTAVLAKNLLEEEDKVKKVHVFNSRSACSGQVAVALKVQEYIEANMEFDAIVTLVEAYIAQMATVFVLEKIDHLQKAGRMSKTKATIANVLNIKLVLLANHHGDIMMHGQARGMNKAIDKMIESFEELGTVSKDKFIVIAHVEAEERAIMVKDKIQAKYGFREVIIVPTKGLSSNYANRGGIVIAF